MTIIVKYFRILDLENNCHTASPDTTGKLTENIIINISQQFVLVAGNIVSQMKINIQFVILLNK